MFQAILKGKLIRGEESLEDLLTSNVFGTLKYLSPNEGIIPLLYAVEDGNGKSPFVGLADFHQIDYEFWPFLSEEGCSPCEPDVLLRVVTKAQKRLIFLIESKFYSGKSSIATIDGKPSDQLAKEWDNLVKLSKREKADPFFVYVTAHTDFPKTEIENSIQEYTSKRNQGMKVSWLSWRKLAQVYSSAQNAMLKDMIAVLTKLGMTYFEGIKNLPIQIWDWNFYQSIIPSGAFRWNLRLFSYDWDFGDKTINFSWQYQESNNIVRWGYKDE